MYILQFIVSKVIFLINEFPLSPDNIIRILQDILDS